jgi:hypothetical protein
MAALTLTDALFWMLGLLFAAALLVQASSRQAEAERLAALSFRSRDMIEARTELREVARKLEQNQFVPPDHDRLDAALRQLLYSGVSTPITTTPEVASESPEA